MTLSDTMTQAVAVGTNNINNHERLIAHLDDIAGQVNTCIEARVLLHCGKEGLQQWAGYVAQRDKRPLDAACPPDTKPVISNQSIEHLAAMLHKVTQEQKDSNLYYYELLPEWCSHAILAKYRVPEEWLADVLTFCRQKRRYRPYFLPLLGERGLWLAKTITNQNWNWVFETEAIETYRLLQSNLDFENEVISSLARRTSITISHLARLQLYFDMWSTSLADFVVSVFELSNVTTSEPVPIALNVLQQCAYRFPLEQAHRLLNVLHTGGERWQPTVQALYKVFLFRKEMLEALYEPQHQQMGEE